MDYIAHSKNAAGKVHSLKDHLEETAYFMRQFTSNTTFMRVFVQVAFMHDMGKYALQFQRYITQGGRRGSVPHAFLGAVFARYFKQNEIAFVVDGHHKGLPDRASLKNDTILPPEWEQKKYQELTKLFLQDIGKSEKEFEKVNLELSRLQRELFIRYLFSALTDADWLSTEKHLDEKIFAARKTIALDYDYLIAIIEKNINEKDKDGPINLLRNEVRHYALSLATGPKGFYSLGLPTGLGKTLISVTWALMHAKQHKLKRIVIVVPYLAITDQTSKTLKEILGETWVLEHHSGYNEEEIRPEQKAKEPHIKKLATENWDYPIIVTTTVQLFDSLFSNKPRRCRKVHNLAESIVIFDEVQTFPPSLLDPILSVLQDMRDIMGTSFLFCTATQPAFEKRENFQNGIDHISPLVKAPTDIFKHTKRVTYKGVENFQPLSLEEVLEKMSADDGSTLMICNTRKNALKAYLEIKKTNKWNTCYHLSKAMCPDHRKKIIEQIREDLKNQKCIFAASTQLVEAGVDFDFPCVYREIAPLESIIQAAGRCNRDGKLLPEGRLGKVYIFRLEEAVFPDALYKTLSLHTLTLLEQNIDKLHDYDFFTEYYAGIVHLFIDTDKKRINEARSEFKFETVADMFHLIEDKTVSFFIADYSAKTRDFLDKIKSKEFLNKDDYDYMQQYCVQVYRKFLEETQGQWEEKRQGYHVWYGPYCEDTGICLEIK
ncbi:MAG: CRISPR-associated helicase Cas3' [Dysgonamonadaceae bacterium]|jgi:CRISPR-associated endonuclease/helicase Cas3|nr:CRISPR-associated helicase Cas3' [Dysgonamonadaceae bacterium]